MTQRIQLTLERCLLDAISDELTDVSELGLRPPVETTTARPVPDDTVVPA